MTLHKIINGLKVVCTDEEEAEIRARWKANDAEVKKTAYVTNRKDEYPSIADQLDMLWHSMDDGQMPRIEPFYSTIADVKKKYPKK
jgi:hypothetical protein